MKANRLQIAAAVAVACSALLGCERPPAKMQVGLEGSKPANGSYRIVKYEDRFYVQAYYSHPRWEYVGRPRGLTLEEARAFKKLLESPLLEPVE